MMKLNKTIDINPELMIQPYKAGIKLVNRARTKNRYIPEEKGYTVDQLLNLSSNVFFLNQNSIIQEINEPTVQSCGFVDYKDAIGRSAIDVFSKPESQRIISTDLSVVQTEQRKIIEEEFFRQDGVLLRTTSLKFPWYDEYNKIFGIFGCAIPHGFMSLSDSIKMLVEIGLFAHAPTFGFEMAGINFTARERDCVFLLKQGKNVKRIAKALNLSPRTVRHYVDNIKLKCNVSTQAELMEKLFQ